MEKTKARLAVQSTPPPKNGAGHAYKNLEKIRIIKRNDFYMMAPVQSVLLVHLCSFLPHL